MLQVKLKIATFYASSAITEPITKSSDFIYNTHRGLYADALQLAYRNLSNIQWESRNADENLSAARQDSVDTNLRTPAPSKIYKGGQFYTASIKVPVELPRGTKLFVPTFHSCLVSRIYALDIEITFEQCKPTFKQPSVFLKLPIQLSGQSNPSAVQDNGEIEPVDDFFSPRSVAPPAPAYLGRSNLSPTIHFPVNGGEESSPPSAQNGDATAVNGTEPFPASEQRVKFAENVGPSTEPGFTHRSSWAPGVTPERPAQNVRMLSAHQRASISFDNEGYETPDSQQRAPQDDQPPQYWNIGGRWRHRGSSAQQTRRASET